MGVAGMNLGRWAARMSAAVILAASLAGNGAAQSSDTQEPILAVADVPSAASGCELHVWPSGGLRSIYHGWLHGGIVDGAVKGRDGYPEVPADPLDTAQQLAMIRAAALQDVFTRTDYAVVIHDTPQSTVTIRQNPARLTASPSACYAELIFEDVFFQQDVVNGGSLKTLIRFRDFGTADRFTKQFGTWTKTPLLAFPPKEPARNAEALAEIRAAFRSNIFEFAGALRANETGGGKKKK